ncbi:12774_t:CDS:2, partial [Racocetra fulgida]
CPTVDDRSHNLIFLGDDLIYFRENDNYQDTNDKLNVITCNTYEDINTKQELKEPRRNQQLNVNEEVKQYNILYFFRFGYYYLISTTTEIRKTCFARTFDDLFNDIDLDSLKNKGINEKFDKDDLVIQHDQTKFTEKQFRLIELDVVSVYRQRTVYISKSASDSMPTNYISVTPFFRSTKHEWKRFIKSKEASFDYY